MSRLLKITDNGNGILVQGTDNILYPQNDTLSFPYNSIIVVTDESDIATFRSAANNDVLFSGLIGYIEVGEDTVTKANIIEKFDAIANQSSGGGGDMSNYYTKSETNTLLEDKADIDDIPTDVSELNNDAGYITQAQVVVNESFPSAWMQALDMEDLITAINNDSDAVVGKVYMDTISLSDLPANMQQAEVKAEIMSELQGTGKVILFTVTSSNQSPYHWEYTSAYGETGTWREWLVASDIANYFDGAEYDSNTKRINFKHNNVVKTYIDATAFIKDGMVDSVAISNGNLVITFNTDAGKEPISIPLTDIFNPANYYDKTATDNLLAAKANSADLATVATSGDYTDLSNKPTIPVVPTNVSAFTNDAGYLTQHQSLANYYTKSEVDAELDTKQNISDAFSGDYNDLTNQPTIPVVPTDVSAFTNDAGYLTEQSLDGYATENWVESQGYLTEHQSLDDYYTKDETDALIPDTSDFLTKSEFDTKEEVISTALNELEDGKQDKLTAGANITIQNNVISATGGGGTQVQADWNQSDSSAVDYIKNKPTIPDTSDFVSKTEYNPKELAIAEALTDLNENKADKSEIPVVPDMSNYYTKTQTDTAISTAIGTIDLSDYQTKAQADIKEEVISTALNSLNTNKVNNGGGVANIVKLTQAQYTQLQTKDNNTLYIITTV